MIKEYEFKSKEEWLKIRSQYIGGSDAGAVVGLNPYKSAYSLWAEKTGRLPGFEGNLITEVGSYLEEFVAKLFEKETGKKVRRKNRTMVNDLYPFACANVDRLVVGEKSILEIKTTNNFPLIRTLNNSTEFPEAYLCQCTHYLAVTGLEKVYLAVLIGCRDFKIYELSRDEDEIDALMSMEQEFWDCVLNDTPPNVDASQATAETLETLYPVSDEVCGNVDLSAYEIYLEEYTILGDKINELKAAREEAGNKVKAFMQEAGSGESPEYTVSWRSTERRIFDAKAFEKENQNIDLTKYYKTTSARTFRVNKKGEVKNG